MMEEQVQNIEKYKTIICTNLIATDVLPLLMRIDTIAQNEVCAAVYEAQSANPNVAATILVDNLVKSKDPGWYQVFVDALTEKKYGIISRVLQHGLESVKNQAIFRELLNVYYRELCDQIDPKQLLPHLIEYQCFIKEDAERVNAAEMLHGKSYATLCLLINVGRRSEDWFKGLMYALTQTGHKDLVATIEPKIAIAADKGLHEVGKVVERLGTINTGVSEDSQWKPRHGKGNALSKETQSKDSGYTEITEASNEGANPKKSQKSGCQSFDTDGCHVTSKVKLPIKNESRSSATSTVSSFASGDGFTHWADPMTPVVIPPVDPLSLNLNEENICPKDMSSCGPFLSGSLSGMSDQSKTSSMSSQRDERHFQLDYKSDPAVDLEGPNLLHPAASSLLSDDTALRDYQLELIQAAMKGQNSIIYAPAGAGKTFAAVVAAKHKLQRDTAKADQKVIHLAATAEDIQKTVDLYDRHVTDHSCVGISTEPARFKKQLQTIDIFVTTLEIFLRALQESYVHTVGVFSLIVFSISPRLMHQLQAVMSYYFQEKQRGSPVPQILGLLDTLQWGQASDEHIAKEDILKLCAQFDSLIYQVETHKCSLRKHVAVRDQEFYSVNGRVQDPFCTVITGLMITIERMIKAEKDGSKEVAVIKRKLNKLPSHRGCREYKMWLKSLQKPVAVISEESERRVYEAYFFNLRIYNEALLINEDCQTSDAIHFIEERLDQHCKYDKDKILQHMFKEKKDELIIISRQKIYANPKLKRLREVLQDYYESEEMDLKAVLFCKSMTISECLEKWMSNDERLERVRVRSLGFSSEGREENHILRHFRKGKAGIVITDGEYEGFIRGLENCNCVIHYMLEEDTVKNQGKCGTLVVRGKATHGDSNKENYIKGWQLLSHLTEEELTQHIKRYQTTVTTTRNRFDTKNSVKFHCGGEGCDVLACYSAEIKKKHGMEAVVSEDFYQKVEVVSQPPKDIKNGMQSVGRLLCKKCQKCKWGVLVASKNTEDKFYVVTVNSFILEFPDGFKRQFKRWADIEGFTIIEG